MRFLLIVLSFCCVSAFAQCPDGYELADTNLVFNGDFSYGNQGFKTDYVYDRGYHWSKLNQNPWGVYTIAHLPRYTNKAFADCHSADGTHNPFMCGDGHFRREQTVWEQNVKVKPNTNYVFRASFTATSFITGVFPAFQFYLDGEKSKILDVVDTCEWVTYERLWNSNSKRRANISIVNYEIQRQGNDFGLDDIQLIECVEEGYKKPEWQRPAEQKVNFNEKQWLIFQEIKPLRVYGLSFVKNKADIKASSNPWLDEIAKNLQKYKNVSLQLDVHAGKPGKAAASLTTGRANKVKAYLVAKGIEAERIVATGLGYKKPLKKDLRKESIQMNERTMIRFFVTEEAVAAAAAAEVK